jgi:hypothetical protein
VVKGEAEPGDGAPPRRGCADRGAGRPQIAADEGLSAGLRKEWHPSAPVRPPPYRSETSPSDRFVSVYSNTSRSIVPLPPRLEIPGVLPSPPSVRGLDPMFTGRRDPSSVPAH